jgi:hypothetical protein
MDLLHSGSLVPGQEIVAFFIKLMKGFSLLERKRHE